MREWKLTNREIAYIEETGADMKGAQEAKKRAYIKAGGTILNPEALPDLLEACKAMVKELRLHTTKWDLCMIEMIQSGKKAIAKAENDLTTTDE